VNDVSRQLTTGYGKMRRGMRNIMRNAIGLGLELGSGLGHGLGSGLGLYFAAILHNFSQLHIPHCAYA